MRTEAEKLKKRLDEYMTWLNEAAPALRNLTGSQLSGAIERYGALTVEKYITDKKVHLHLGNFYDQAYLMVRMNKGTPARVTGGDLTQAAGNLYLLSAEQEDVYIEFE